MPPYKGKQWVYSGLLVEVAFGVECFRLGEAVCGVPPVEVSSATTCKPVQRASSAFREARASKQERVKRWMGWNWEWRILVSPCHPRLPTSTPCRRRILAQRKVSPNRLPRQAPR